MTFSEATVFFLSYHTRDRTATGKNIEAQPFDGKSFVFDGLSSGEAAMTVMVSIIENKYMDRIR